MNLDGEWINKLDMMWVEKKFDELKSEIKKVRMEKYNYLELIEDKIFLDYKMAYLEYLDKNNDFANMYLDNLKDFFKDEYIKISNENSYYKYKWLLVNNNKGILNNEILISEMIQVYKYFKEIKDEATSIVALENIEDIKGNGLGILENINKLLKYKGKKDWNLINSMVKDCDKISHDLYITALELVNKYKLNIDLQVV